MVRLRFDGEMTEHRCALPDGSSAILRRAGENQLAIEVPYAGAFGMGERFDAVNQKGRVARNAVIEKFCRQGSFTYCPIPFFFTDTGFGFFADTGCETSFDFTGEEILVQVPDGTGLTLLTGTPEQIVRDFVGLTGTPALPPKWAFGPWISANRWNRQEQVERQLADLAHYRYPATVLVVEAWSDESTFYLFNGMQHAPSREPIPYEDMDFSASAYWSDPKQMIDELHAQGLHLVLWQIPAYKKLGAEDPPNPQHALDEQEAEQKGFCVRRTDGTPYRIPEGHWFEGSMIPDFTNPATVESWFSKRLYLLELGVDGFKTDGGEFLYDEDIALDSGMPAAEARNRYPQLYTAAYADFAGKDRVLFSRAGYTGAHTTPILWAGDQQSANDELESVLKAGLSAALSGVLFWGFDIGGFAGPLPTLDLYRRSTQLACFCPVMQWHSEPDGGQFRDLLPGAEGNNERSPWNVAAVHAEPSFVDEMRYWHRLRMNLLPYLYSTAMACVRQGAPMMRPLLWYWPELTEVMDEFLLGDSLLIAPLLEENTDTRELVLPDGEWFDFYTGCVVHGGRTLPAGGNGKIPVFLRSGHGVALHLGESGELGSDVGNGTEAPRELHFLLGGATGSMVFMDETGEELHIRWEKGMVQTEGKLSCQPSFTIYQS